MATSDTIPDLTSYGIYPAGSPQGQQIMSNNRQSMSQMGSSMSSGSMSGGGGGVPQIPSPNLGSFQYSSEAQNYPTWMRNMGENQAQQAFQQQVNSGIRLGSAAQGYQHAMDNRNQSRLAYSAAAGQNALTVQQALALEQQRRNDEALRMFGIQVGQRGQDMSYQESMMRAMSGGGGGGGGGIRMGGGGSIGGGRSTGGGFIPLTSHPGSGLENMGISGYSNPYQSSSYSDPYGTALSQTEDYNMNYGNENSYGGSQGGFVPIGGDYNSAYNQGGFVPLGG